MSSNEEPSKETSEMEKYPQQLGLGDFLLQQT